VKELKEDSKKKEDRQWFYYLYVITIVSILIAAGYGLGLHIYYHPINYDYLNYQNESTTITMEKNSKNITIDFKNKIISRRNQTGTSTRTGFSKLFLLKNYFLKGVMLSTNDC
jgi:hypothetical protein